MEDNGTKSSKSRVVKTESITVTHVLNEAPRLTFQASRADVGNVNTPFVVGVEYSTGGSFQPLPEHNLFIVEQDSDDSLDPAKVVTYECQGFVAWLLSGALHNWHRTAKDGKRTWVEPGKNTASAGWVLNGMFTESKSGGWFPALTKDFNGTNDSAGKSWTNSDRVEQAWELDKNIMQILEQMTLDGLCDWTSVGTTWRLFRPDTYGTDKAELVLGGTGFESVPVKVDASSLYSHIRAIPEGIPWQNFISDTTIRNRFGHRSVVLQQSGVKSAATSARLAQPHIEAGKEVLREESYNWTPRIEPNGSRGICPWADFKLGDHVTARSRGGKLVRRVVGIIAEQNSGMTKVQVRVGEKIGSAGSRLARRLESVAVGGIVGGSGSAFPSTPPPVLTEPDRVNGLVLVSNVGEWLPDWTAKSVIEISWAPVTDNVDGSESAIESYEVWIRRPDTQLRYLTTTTDTSLTIDSVTPGETVLIAVRAMSDARRYGEFSLELQVTAAIPKSMVPNKVTGLALQSQVAEFTPTGPRATLNFKWTAVTKTVEDVDISVDVYRVWVDGALHAEVESLSTSVVIPSQVSAEIRVSAVANGLESDRSEPLVVTGELPPVFDLDPTAPVLSSSHGNVRAVWDGLYTTPTLPGAHTVRVEARVGSSAWVQQGSALTGAGEQLVSVGEIGDTVEVRFTAYDQLGRLTGTSAVETITVAGVGLSDLNEAVNDYLSDIETMALEAQQSADGGNKIHYGNTAPAGTDHKVGDTWFDGANGNRINEWNGTDWVPKPMNSGALADNAVTAIKLANDAVTSAKIATGAVGSDELDNAVKVTIQNAQDTAAAAQSAAGSAQTAASNAQTTANDAASAAANAAGIAGGKADVLIQASAPATAMRKATTLWIDTTGDSNTPKRWSGSAWVAVTDKAATDAAAAAATAQSTANNAQSLAAAAQSAAGAAQTAADSAAAAAAAAQTTANGRAQVVRSTSAASSPESYRVGDQWWRYSGTEVTGFWLHTGSTWVQQTLDSEIIAHLDAGKITTGYLDADRIQAKTITGAHIAGATVTAANMVAGTITAASGIIANAAIGVAQIADGAITNAKIANATITNAKIANLDAAKITTGTLDAGRIAANSISASKLLIGDVQNLISDPGFIDPDAWSTSSTREIMSRTAAGVPANAPVSNNVMRVASTSPSNNDVLYRTGTLNNSIAVEPGEELYVEYWVARDAACNSGFRFFIATRDAAGGSTTWPNGGSQTPTSVPAGEWQKIVTKITVPAGRYQATLQFGSSTTGSTAPAGNWYVANPVYRRMNTGEMIVDGAVRARHIEMDQGFAEKFEASEALFGTVGVDQLKPNIGDLITIEGNIAITGLTDPVDGKLAQMEAATRAVSDAVSDVHAIAERADGKALSAYGMAESLQTNLANHTKVFRVTNGVPEVATLNGLNVLRLEPDRIEMEQGGQIVTYWSNGELVVSNVLSSHIKIVNPNNDKGHIIEHDGASGIIINPL